MKNRRNYLRISTVLPVEFYFLNEQNRAVTPWLQGFTCNIGKGGLCIFINDLWWGFADKMKDNKNIELKLEIPNGKEFFFSGKIIWTAEEKREPLRYLIGVEFKDKKRKEVRFLFIYALFKKIIPFFLSILFFLLLSLNFFSFWQKKILFSQNKELLKDYLINLEKITDLKISLKDLQEKEINLKNHKQELEERLNNLKKEKEEDKKLILRLEKEISILKSRLQKDLLFKEDILNRIKERNRERIISFEKIKTEIYSWIKNRQNIISGLVLSYEGDNDLKNVSFTYDQALAVIIFSLNKDKERAEKILNFYAEKFKKKESIYNAYFTDGEVFEYVLHSGPLTWLGIAILNYTKLTNDKKYLFIAEEIAKELTTLIDKEGGLRGGKDIFWYSTEHNLDAFSFFTLLYELTGNKIYKDQAEKIKQWLGKYSYSQYGIPVKRGRGDSTIATDTYAWSIASLGIENLLSLEMSPDIILDFAINNCEVEVMILRENRELKVKGFDFAKTRNLARGGVISCEWTAQMILSLEILANYYQEKNLRKSLEYFEKAKFYFEELQKLIVISPSKVGRINLSLPYASQANVDTGHNWRTPKGDSTGSLSANCYFLFAYYGYNPLKAEFLEISLKNTYERGD